MKNTHWFTRLFWPSRKLEADARSVRAAGAAACPRRRRTATDPACCARSSPQARAGDPARMFVAPCALLMQQRWRRTVSMRWPVQRSSSSRSAMLLTRTSATAYVPARAMCCCRCRCRSHVCREKSPARAGRFRVIWRVPVGSWHARSRGQGVARLAGCNRGPPARARRVVPLAAIAVRRSCGRCCARGVRAPRSADAVTLRDRQHALPDPVFGVRPVDVAMLARHACDCVRVWLLAAHRRCSRASAGLFASHKHGRARAASLTLPM